MCGVLTSHFNTHQLTNPINASLCRPGRHEGWLGSKAQPEVMLSVIFCCCLEAATPWCRAASSLSSFDERTSKRHCPTAMCNDRSWKTCSIATIVFSSLLMLGMFIGVGVMNAMFANNMRCYRDVNSNGYVRCGTSWGNYILAASGARDCTGCGEAITSYTDCEIAASSSYTAHLTGVLMGSASWSSGAAPPGRGGPRGCHIQEGSKGSNMDGAPDWSKFEFNANVDGTSAVGYYTPVCRGAYRRELFEEMHHIAAQHPSGDGVARVKLALSNIAQTFGLGAAMKLPAVLALSPEGRKLTEAIPNDDSCGYFSSDGDCDDGGLCSCGTDLSDCGYRFSSDSCGSISPPPPYNPGYIPNDDSCGYPFSSDGACDDGSTGGYALCSCGTDLSDCGYRFSSDSCYQRGKTANESVEEIEKVRAPPLTSLRVPPCAPPPFPSVGLYPPAAHPSLAVLAPRTCSTCSTRALSFLPSCAHSSFTSAAG